MRGTRVRSLIGLIRKGSGSVVGVADLVATVPDPSIAKLRANVAKRRVPAHDIGDAFKRRTACVLNHARPLARPVRYRHPPGAMIWVNLDAADAAMVELGLEAVKSKH